MRSWHRAALVPILVCLVACLGGTRGARGEAFRIDSPPDCEEQGLDLAALPGGGLVAVWQAGATSAVPSTPRIVARLFDANRAPLGSEFLVNGSGDGSGAAIIGPAVAVGAGGDFLIVWGEFAPHRLVARHFNAAGEATGPEILLGSQFPDGGVAVTATPTGFAVVALQDLYVYLWRLGPTGSPSSPGELVYTGSGIPEDLPVMRDPAMTYSPSGLVLAWAEERSGAASVVAVVRTASTTEDLLFVPDVHFNGEPLLLEPAVAVDGTGKILVAWNGSPNASPFVESDLVAQVFGPDRTTLGPPFPLADEISRGLGFSAPDAAGLDEGFVVAWQSLPPFPGDVAYSTWLRRIGDDGAVLGPPIFVASSPSASQPTVTIDGQERVTVGWQAGARPPFGPAVATCFSQGLYAASPELSPKLLLLQGGRFEARIHWTDHAGHSGEGQAVSLTGDSGYFWFFGEDNVEVMVKVLDGRAVNGRFWVFFGSLSDVAYTLAVTDRLTGLTKTYENPAGRLASRADTLAFPAAAAASASVTAGLAAAPQPSHIPADEGVGPCAPPSVPAELHRPGLCLGERFEVEVAWQANGTHGAGQGVQLTDDSGYLWFFGSNNAELVVKVLDGRAVNGRFWVFYGALSNVQYSVTVRDTHTGLQRVYTNPAGQLSSLADIRAF